MDSTHIQEGRQEYRKEYRQFEQDLKEILVALTNDLKLYGPNQANRWPHYKVRPVHHCHLRVPGAQFQMVATWEVIDNVIKIIEVKYVGSHEKAPY